MTDKKSEESDEKELLREEEAYKAAQREAQVAREVQGGYGLETFESGIEG
ncbi:hypothetical protein [Microbacterium sp. H1-D42]|nr:hypothetical protein [Microbacterium sp. H1-D42]UNK69535.1 hypothetical protein MNR00_10115 [Microbacterium sp. H1-D42]